MGEKKCKHPTFRFKYFEHKPKSIYDWHGMGYKLVCGKCGKPITIKDIRKQKNTLTKGRAG